jgi:hypothetical protein
MGTTSSQLLFKFRFVRDGQVQSMFSLKGKANEHQLIIGKDTIDYELIHDKTTRDNKLIIVIGPETELSKKTSKHLIENNALILEISKVKAEELEKFIGRASSKIEVAKNKQRFIDEGKKDLFKCITCPNCEAQIDLSELKETKFIYCNYCETVFSHENKIVTNGDIYKICDECNLFGRVKGYTETYFYFLILVYGYRYKRRYLCDCCVDKIFWKTFLVNLIFILGVPSSIYMKIKSLVGRNDSDKYLLEASKLSIKGKYQEANDQYKKLHMEYSGHPGVYFNEAMGYFNGENSELAIKCLVKSLESCNNYLPTIRLVAHIQDLADESNEA